jgi:class 3 adenylate cyclase/tetratricopeptide (TPR) repeat protein
MERVLRCPRCRCENRAEARFCNDCGAALASLALSEGDRRQATVLFADISGYTEQCASYDPEHVRAMLSRFFGAMDTVVQGYGGNVIDRAGDAVMAVFGAPKAHGNDAERAIRAAFDMHRAAGQLEDCAGQPLRLHIGISSGEVVAADIGGDGTSKYSITGATVNLAARLDSLAGPGETLMSDALYQLVSRILVAQRLGESKVKGFAKAVTPWKVLAFRTAPFARTRFVGRSVELARILDALSAVPRRRSGVTILVRGDAGIGKSRLVEEVRERAQALGFHTLSGQVLDFGVRRGREALPAILKGVLDVTEDENTGVQRSAVRRALELGLMAGDDELFVNELLDVEQPPELKAVLEAMDNSTRQRRSAETFAAVLRRAAERRPLLLTVEDIHWGSPWLLRHLSALEAAAAHGPMVLIFTSRHAEEAMPESSPGDLGRAPRTEIHLAPLTSEEAQMLATQLPEGSSSFTSTCIQRAEGNPLFLEQLLQSAHDGEERHVPPTIQSLVLERIDRIPRRDRSALQAAAVLGQMFSLESLRAVCADATCTVDALVSARIVRPFGTDYLFAHALIQEAVYGSLLTDTRRRLHARCAQWFATSEPMLHAQHLDRAESPDAPAAYLAASRLEAGRFRFDSALRLAGRGASIAAGTDVSCALALLQGELLRETGQSEDSIRAFRTGLDLAHHDGERCLAWTGIAAGHRVTGELASAMDALDRAQAIAERCDLATQRSRVHHLRGNLHFVQGNVSACQMEHQHALDLARAAGEVECEVHALGGVADALYAQARIALALEHFRRCITIGEQHGWLGVATSNRCMAAVCVWLQGDLPAGITELGRACEDARRIAAVPVQLLAVDTIAILLLEAGRFEEAERFCVEGLSLARPAGSRRYESLLLWNVAMCHLVRGDSEGARRCLDDSLALARETGLGSMGPAIYARLARAAAGPAQMDHALREGENLLRGPCLAHARIMFYRDAIEATIAARDWDRTLAYAQALEALVQDEPLRWAQLVAARAYVLRDAALELAGSALVQRLAMLREQVLSAGWKSALQEIDAQLARSAP